MSQGTVDGIGGADVGGRAPLRASGRTVFSRRFEKLIESFIFFCGITSVLFVALIFIFIFKEAFPLLLKYPFAKFFLGTEWTPVTTSSAILPDFGLIPLLLSSVLVTLGAVVIAVPLGVMTALFIAEIAPPKIRAVLKSVIELLAALPSVVLGFFGTAVLLPVLQNGLNLGRGDTMLAGAITLAFMAVPTIATISEDALAAVPRDVREGSLGLGATHWQTIWRVQVPAAFSGIVAAVMLGVGRAIGETMVVLMVTGNGVGTHLSALMKEPGAELATQWKTDPNNLFATVLGTFQHVFGAYTEVCRTITATIAAEMGEITPGDLHYNALFMLGVVLFVLTFLINMAADAALRKAGARR
jgi:phosphate transport system permease protein